MVIATIALFTALILIGSVVNGVLELKEAVERRKEKKRAGKEAETAS